VKTQDKCFKEKIRTFSSGGEDKPSLLVRREHRHFFLEEKPKQKNLFLSLRTEMIASINLNAKKKGRTLMTGKTVNQIFPCCQTIRF